MMHVIVADRPGPPEVPHLLERPGPLPGNGEVCVAVQVAAVMFVDTAIRAGRPWPTASFPAVPAVPGDGVAGTVDRLGDGVGARVISLVGTAPVIGETLALEEAAMGACRHRGTRHDREDGPPARNTHLA